MGFLCNVFSVIKSKQSRVFPLATGSPSSDDEAVREKIVKKMPSESRSPFYLTGTAVDMPDDRLDVDTFQVSVYAYFYLFILSYWWVFVESSINLKRT